MPFFTMLLTYLVTFLITELLRPKPDIENAKPASLGDFNVPTATEGRVVPIIFGRVRLSGPNVVWYGDLGTVAITRRVKTGLFSKKTQTTGFKYSIGLQMAICRGPMTGTDRIFNIRNDENHCWGEQADTADTPVLPIDAGSDLSINLPDFFGGPDAGGGGGLIGTFTMYPGTETQDLSSYLAPFQTPQPTYRGTVYLTWNKGEIGQSPSLRKFDFELSRNFDGLDLATLQPGDEIVAEGMNPMNVVFEVLTNTEWGLAVSTSDINSTSLRAVAAILATEGSGFSWIWDRVIEVLDVIRQIEEQTDGILTQDAVTGIFDFRLIRADYVPASLELLDETNVVDLSKFGRPSWASTSNVVNLQFADRGKNYTTSYAIAQDMANIDIVGSINAVEVKYPGVKDAATANALAWRELRQLSYPIATGRLTSDRSQYDILPGDVRALSWDVLGLVRLPIRITKVNRGRILDNKIVIDWTEDIFDFAAGSFSDPLPSLWIPPDDSAFAPFDEILLEIPFRITDVSDTGINTVLLQVGTIVVRNGGQHVSYSIFATEVDAPGPAPVPSENTSIPPGDGALFSPFGLLNGTIDRGQINGFQDAVGFEIDAALDLDLVLSTDAAGLEAKQNVLLIDDEIMLFRTVAGAGGVFQLSDLIRGALDTLPADHANNAPVYIFSYGIGLVNDLPNPDVTRNYQVRNQPRTAFDVLDFASTSTLGITTVGRAGKAYPPRDVQINPTAPGGGYFPVDAGSPSGAELVGTFALRWHGSDKFSQLFATAWDDPHVQQEAGAGFRIVITEDPLGVPVVKLDVSGIPAGATEGAYNAAGFADDTVTDQYQVEMSSVNANGESQVWLIGPFAIYGFGYKFDEKFGGDTDGFVAIKGVPPPTVDPIPGVTTESIFRLTASGVFDTDDDLHVKVSFLELGTTVAQDEDYNVIGTSGSKTSITDYLIAIANFIAGDFDPLKVVTLVDGNVLTVSSVFGTLGGSLQNNTSALRIDLLQKANFPQNAINQVMHFDLWEADTSTKPATEILAPNNLAAYNQTGVEVNKLDLSIEGLTAEAKADLPLGGSRHVQLLWGGKEVAPGTQAINREAPLRDGTVIAGQPNTDLLSRLEALAATVWSEYIQDVRWSNYNPVPGGAGNDKQDRPSVEVTMRPGYKLVAPSQYESAPDNTNFTGTFGKVRLLGKQLFLPRGYGEINSMAQVVRLSLGHSHDNVATPETSIVAGQIYTVILDGVEYSTTVIAGDASDPFHFDGIFARLTTVIDASGLFTVIASNTALRKAGGATYVKSIDIARDVVNTAFTFDARASYGLILDAETFIQ